MNNVERLSNHGLKPKTVEKILRRKIEDWLYSIKNIKIEDEALLTDEEKEIKKLELKEFRQRIRDNIVISGGAITSLLMGEKPNDYDVYFKSLEVAKEVANYYIKKLDKKLTEFVPSIEIIEREDKTGIQINIKSMGIIGSSEKDTEDYKYFETQSPAALEAYMTKHFKRLKKDDNRRYFPSLITSNAISLTNDLQIITRFVGEPEQIHDNYDFVHVTNYYTENEGLILKLSALTAIMSKTLKYVGSRYPICSMFRTRKFINRGWSITAGEMLKIAYDINKLDLNNPKVFMESLAGVDQAYFNQIIHLMNERLKNNQTIDRTYLIAVIDRVFDDEEPDEFIVEEITI